MSTPEALGVCLRPQYGGEYSVDTMRHHAMLADDNGFDSVWLAESWGQNVIPVLADLAARTQRVTVGTAILNVYSRTPSLLGMTAATMSELYPGRFVLGIGAGTKALVEDWHGLSFDRPVARMEDTIAVVRSVTNGETLDHTGPTVTVSGFRLRVPADQPRAPIFVAALGNRGLDLVGRAADGWLPYLVARRRLGDYVDRLRITAETAGRTDGGPRIAPLIVTCVDEDAEVARAQARRHIASYLGAMGPHYRGFVSRHGYADQVAAVADAWGQRDRDRAAALVTDDMVDDIAVCGSPVECADQIAGWRRAGADLPILHFPSGTTAHGVDLALRALAPAPAAADSWEASRAG